MVFAFDEIGGSDDSFHDFQSRKRDLVDALLAISEEVGDASHVSGAADYVVRIATAKWAFESVPAPNAFVVVDNVDNVSVFERVARSELQSVAVLSTDDWFDEICDAFKEFRRGIGD